MNKDNKSNGYPYQDNSFNYALLQLDSEKIAQIQDKTQKIKFLLRRTAQDIIDIGGSLIEVKSELGHGNFRKWLKAEFDFSLATATKFMQAYQKFHAVDIQELNIAPSALYLLSAPSTPDESRGEAISLAKRGVKITYSLAKKLKYEYNGKTNKQKSDINSSHVSENQGLLQKIYEYMAKYPKECESLPNLIKSEEIDLIIPLVDQNIKLALRNKYNLSLIFVFFKNSFYQNFPPEIKETLMNLYQNSIGEKIRRKSDLLFCFKNKVQVLLPGTDEQGVKQIVNELINYLEEINNKLNLIPAKNFIIGYFTLNNRDINATDIFLKMEEHYLKNSLQGKTCFFL